MKRFSVALLAVALLVLLAAPAAFAIDPTDDTQVEPGLYVPHTEPVVKSMVFTQPDPYAPPSALAFTAHCDSGLGYDLARRSRTGTHTTTTRHCHGCG